MNFPPDCRYVPNFLTRLEQIQLIEEIDNNPWSDAPLKRRVQHYGYRYDYRARSVDQSSYLGKLPKFLNRVAKKLKKRELIPLLPDQCIVNEYNPGQGIAAHVDCVPCFKDTIVTISLGWAYEMEFVRIKGKMKSVCLLEVGSALILCGESRYQWTHEIKARYSDNNLSRRRRLSVTFRHVQLP